MGPVLRPMASRKSSVIDQSIRTELGTRGGKRNKRYKSNVCVTEVTFLLQVTDSVTFLLLYSFKNRNKTMLPAVDSFGKSILPTKGVKGFCPGCGGKMVARCGSIVRHYWAHAKGKDCDTWSDSVGPWHLAWQDCFPRECQEVWMGDNNEHRADVKGEHQILEVQKSPISATEIAERESFYGNMSWMLYGEDFEDRFKLYAIPESRELLFEFRWLRWKKSWVGAKKTVYIHFRKGIGKLLEFNDDGTGVVQFVDIEHMRRAFDSRFDPSPVQQAGKGFEPLWEGFLERCVEVKQEITKKNSEREDDADFFEKYYSFLEYCREICPIILRSKDWRDNEIIKDLREFELLNPPFCRIRWYEKQLLPDIFLKFFPDSLEILAKEHSFLHGRILVNISRMRDFLHAVLEAEGKLGESLVDIKDRIDEQERQRKELRMICSHAKMQPVILSKFIDYSLALLAPEIESYALLARFDKDFPRADRLFGLGVPQREEVKAFLVFVPEKLRSEILERVKFRSEMHLQDQKVEQEKQEAARARSEEVAKRSLTERRGWPLDEHAGHLARAFDGEDMGSTSIAMHVAMFPGSRWANEVSDEQLRVAKERLKDFNPVEVWK